MAEHIRLLGFTHVAAADDIMRAIHTVPGPATLTWRQGRVAALGQKEAKRAPWTRLGKDGLLGALRTVQMRLERACMAAPFLPMDPASFMLDAAEVPSLLVEAEPALFAAVEDFAALQQWDVVLRWQAEAVVAARHGDISAQARTDRAALAQAVGDALALERQRRHAALESCVRGHVRAMAALGGGPAETGLTVLVRRGGEADVERALQALPAFAATDASVDLRGPLPPVTFGAVAAVQAEPGDIARAWRLLRLPAMADEVTLRAAWVGAAGRCHPDHAGGDGAAMAQANAAYGLLQSASSGAVGMLTLAALQRHARRRLVAPAKLAEQVA